MLLKGGVDPLQQKSEDKKKKEDEQDPKKPLEPQTDKEHYGEDFDALAALRHMNALVKELGAKKDNDSEGQTDVIVKIFVTYNQIPSALRSIMDMKAMGAPKLSEAIAFLNQVGMCHKNRAFKLGQAIHGCYPHIGGNLQDLMS